MNTKPFAFATAAILVALAGAGGGCSRQSRGNADADENRAATPAEGGATSTAGSAGKAENFGDTDAKRKSDEASPSGRSITGGASTGPDYTLDRSDTPSGQPTQSRAEPGESPNTPKDSGTP